MILQIKATKANGDVINVYPTRDGDDQTDQELIDVSIGWQKLKSDFENGVACLYENIQLFSHGELIEEYTPHNQPEPAKVSKVMQARIKELYKECGRGAIFCNLETLGSGDYTQLDWIVASGGLKDFKQAIDTLRSYDPQTEYVLVIVPAQGDLDVSIYTYD